MLPEADSNRCESCATDQEVEDRPSMTMYPWDGAGEDPNRPVRLCPSCAEDYRDYWNEMWESYRSSAGV